MWLGLRAHRGRRRPCGAGVDRRRSSDGRGRAELLSSRRPDRAVLRPLRRPGGRSRGGLGQPALRADGARRAPLRSRRRRRQGQLPAPPPRGLRAGARRRVARERALPHRGRGGGGQPLGPQAPARRRGPGRLRDRLRLGDGRREHSRCDLGQPWTGPGEHRGAGGRARPAFRFLRRGGAQRSTRAAADARRGGSRSRGDVCAPS